MSETEPVATDATIAKSDAEGVDKVVSTVFELVDLCEKESPVEWKESEPILNRVLARNYSNLVWNVKNKASKLLGELPSELIEGINEDLKLQAPMMLVKNKSDFSVYYNFEDIAGAMDKHESEIVTAYQAVVEELLKTAFRNLKGDLFNGYMLNGE